MPRGSRLIRCFAEGCEGKWEATCLDFDLAVQGRSFQDVYEKLSDQIALYVEGVAALPEPDRDRLLNRRAPIHSWVRAVGRTLAAGIGRDGNRPERHAYDHRIDGGCRAAA
jgi:hypothetical protein